MLRQWSLAAFQISIDVTFPQWDVTYAEMLSEVRYESYETSLSLWAISCYKAENSKA